MSFFLGASCALVASVRVSGVAVAPSGEERRGPEGARRETLNETLFRRAQPSSNQCLKLL
eukprot:9818319-Alexandrium_andersonii.AAC.1